MHLSQCFRDRNGCILGSQALRTAHGRQLTLVASRTFEYTVVYKSSDLAFLDLSASAPSQELPTLTFAMHISSYFVTAIVATVASARVLPQIRDLGDFPGAPFAFEYPSGVHTDRHDTL